MFLSLDIGGSKISYAYIEKGKILAKEKIYYNEKGINNLESFKEIILDIFTEHMPKNIGVSVAGFIKNTLVVNSPNVPWMNGLDFSELFPEGTNLIVENDANIFAFSQAIKMNLRNIIGIIWGTGIGGGIIINGQIFKGDSFFAGEIGHMRYCDTTYEDLIGTKGIMEKYHSEKGYMKYPLDIYREDKDWFFSYTSETLSSLIASLYQFTGIRNFVFGGGIGGNLDDTYYLKLTKKIKEKILFNPDKEIKITKAKTSEEGIFMSLYYLSQKSND